MVKVNYASLQTQSSTMSSASQSRVAGFNQLISAFDSFGGSGDELIGSGYDAARVHATSVMGPYYKGFILYSEAVADAANTLADNYVAKCGAENLDEEQLQAEIDSLSRGCMSLSASISGLQSKTKPAEGDAARISRLQEQLTAAQSQLTTVQEKLANLRAFSAESLLACTSADTYQLLISQAMSGVSASFGGGGFTLPEDLSWVSDVEQGWADREIALENNYLSALEKVKNGESLTESELTAIERYAAAYPDSVDASVLKYVQEARQVKAEEMKIRGLIDKVDAGKSLTDEETKALQDYQSNHPDSNLLEHVKHALGQSESKKKEISRKTSNKEAEDFWAEAQKYCQENGIDFGSFMGEVSRDTLQTLMEEGPDKIRKMAPEFYKFVTQRFQSATAKATIASLLSAYSTSGNANIAGRIGKIVGNVFSKAKPIIQGTGKVLNGLFIAQDFKDQLDNGESLPNATIKTAMHSWISGTVTTAVTTSVAGGIGGTIGATLGTFIPIPGAGTVIGYAIGVAAGVAVSWGVNKVADLLYDNTVGKAVNDVWNKGTEFVGNTVKSVGKSIGDGVSGFFSGLGTAFGF